jgi:stage III sporulation protein AC
LCASGAAVQPKAEPQRRDGQGGRMSVSLIFKIAAVGILVTILNQVLKHSGREDHAFLISLAGLILVLTWIVPYIYDLFVMMQELFEL